MDDSHAEESDNRRKLEERIDTYTAFLTQNGESFQTDEVEPVLDEYLAVFRELPFSFLQDLSVDEVDHFAREAYTSAYEKFVNRRTDAGILQILIKSIASAKEIEQGLIQQLRESGRSTDGISKSWRDFAIKRLWVRKLWREPWISLVNQEFPGEEPTAADIERYENEVAEQDEAALRYAAMQTEFTRELEMFLVERGYIAESQDHFILQEIARDLVMIAETDQKHIFSQRSKNVATDLVASWASEPEHPAWQALLQHYFSDVA